jgi:hypothetical protein
LRIRHHGARRAGLCQLPQVHCDRAITTIHKPNTSYISITLYWSLRILDSNSHSSRDHGYGTHRIPVNAGTCPPRMAQRSWPRAKHADTWSQLHTNAYIGEPAAEPGRRCVERSCQTGGEAEYRDCGLVTGTTTEPLGCRGLNFWLTRWGIQERRRLEESYSNGLRKLARRNIEGADLG